VNLLNIWHWEIPPHPPCSPDLAPADYHLFSKMKKHSQTDEDIKVEVKQWMHLQEASFYHQGFDHCDQCFNRYTGYVQKWNVCAYI
jgi:hypothetical protein